MNTKSIVCRFVRISALTGVFGASMSCMTTYDAAGRPVQSVDPAAAVAGAAAAGLIGYAIANDNDHHHGHYGGGYYRPGPYYGGYSRGGYYRHR